MAAAGDGGVGAGGGDGRSLDGGHGAAADPPVRKEPGPTVNHWHFFSAPTATFQKGNNDGRKNVDMKAKTGNCAA